jgi:hypothetical protein
MDSEPVAVDERAAEIYWWRTEELERAGYSTEVASLVAADHRIDLHQACDLVRRGCPEQTAYRILF